MADDRLTEDEAAQVDTYTRRYFPNALPPAERGDGEVAHEAAEQMSDEDRAFASYMRASFPSLRRG